MLWAQTEGHQNTYSVWTLYMYYVGLLWDRSDDDDDDDDDDCYYVIMIMIMMIIIYYHFISIVVMISTGPQH